MWDSDASFTTTHWSLVLQLGEQDPDQSEAALAELCRRYWYPLYTFVRRSVGDAHEAQDLTQSFFALLLEKGLLSRATPERGRFRNFLLASIKNFMSNEKDRAKAHKRGGEITKLSLDLVMGEVRLNREPTHNLSPERVFERQWALTLLDLVIVRLQAEYAQAGKTRLFEVLKGTLAGDRKERSYASAATTLNLSEEATRQAAYRLRNRYREILREEVAHSVADPAEIDEEITTLFQMLGS